MFDIVTTLPYWSYALSTYTIGTTPTLIAGNEPQRAILYITAPPAASLQVAIDPVPPVGFPGQVSIPAGETHRFTWSLDGPMSTYPWLAWVASGSGDVTVTEVWWRPKGM